MRSLVSALASLLLCGTLLRADSPVEDARLLREAGVPTDPVGLPAWSRSLRASPKTREKAQALLGRLGDASFEVREKAAGDLLRLGPAILPLVQKASSSSDPEVARRARQCARRLERQAANTALVAAVVRRLETAGTPDCALALVELFASLCDEMPTPSLGLEWLVGEPMLADQVRESLANLLRRSEPAAKAVRRLLSDRQPERRCAAALALIHAGDRDALPEIRKVLEDSDRGARLGVARALALRKEKAAVAVLIGLIDEEDRYSTLAEELLSELAGDEPPTLAEGESVEARRKRRASWEAWWKKNQARAEVFGLLSDGKVVRFTSSAGEITKGYRSFVYEATVEGCKAEVSGGRLRLRGDHFPGDQRLVITSRNAMGRKRWPDALDIAVKLGGTGKESGAWHVGVVVGRVKVLFHPDLPMGAFRAELVDTYQQLVPNEDMGFTPAADIMHSLSIRVRRKEQGYRLDVTVAEGNGGARYRKVFEVSSEQMGSYDRVGLERSGRTGGDALFEMVSVKRGR